jgi:hypothetical protein
MRPPPAGTFAQCFSISFQHASAARAIKLSACSAFRDASLKSVVAL